MAEIQSLADLQRRAIIFKEPTDARQETTERLFVRLRSLFFGLSSFWRFKMENVKNKEIRSPRLFCQSHATKAMSNTKTITLEAEVPVRKAV